MIYMHISDALYHCGRDHKHILTIDTGDSLLVPTRRVDPSVPREML